MRLLLAALLALTAPAAAQEAGGLMVPVASRLFLVGDPPGEGGALLVEEGDLALSAVGWIADVIARDPVLDGAAVMLVETEDRSDQILSAKGLPSLYEGGPTVPRDLARPGLIAEAPPGEGPVRDVLYRPAQGARDLMARCSLMEGGALCELSATYAPEARIVLSAVTQDGLPRDLADLRARAERLREIAGCLDVTAEVPADPAARLRALRAGNPRLEDCTQALLS